MVDKGSMSRQSNLSNFRNIDFLMLIKLLVGHKFKNLAIILFFLICAVVYALSLPNVYKSEALYTSSSSNEQGALAGLASQFGGLAALGGINLGGSADEQIGIALEVLQSRKFLIEFINKHEIKKPLFAWEKWDIVNNEPIYDESVYDTKNNKWVREVTFPKMKEPSDLEAFIEFKEVLSVSRDEITGLITISIEHYSPVHVMNWVTELMDMLNENIRLRERSEAARSIEYLNNQLEDTILNKNKVIIYQLLEEQLKTLMLTEVRKDYPFRVVDPSYVPELKSKPNRILIVALGGILGVISAVCLTLMLAFRQFSSLNFKSSKV